MTTRIACFDNQALDSIGANESTKLGTFFHGNDRCYHQQESRPYIDAALFSISTSLIHAVA